MSESRSQEGERTMPDGRISDEIEGMVCADYISGMNSSEVAQRHGISKSSVGNILKRNGVPTRAPFERCADRDRAIIEHYQEGASQKETAERFGLSQTGVGLILERHGVRARFRLTEEEKDQAVSLYLSGSTLRQIARQFGVNFTAICSLLRCRGIERRTKRIWHFDETFFVRSDDQVAYWMGFFMADGNIRRAGKNTWQFTLALNEKDRCLLEQLCHDLNLSTNLLKTHQRTMKNGNPQTLVWFRLSHESLQDWLLRWGIVPRKSYNFVKPTIPVELYPGFLRGWFDGDGCLSISEKKSIIEVRIAGNELGMAWYAKALGLLGYRGRTTILFQQTGIGSAYYLRIGGERSVCEFYDLLNVRDGIRLDRKWTGLEAIIEKRKSEAQDKLNEECKVVEAYEEGRTEIGLAREFRMGTKRVREVLIKAGAPVKRRRSPTRVNEETKEDIVSDYSNGLKQDEIAERYGLTQARISSILAKYQVRTIPSHVRRMTDLETAEKIASAYQSGLSQAEVALKIGMSVSGVHKVLKRMNVTLRPARRYRRKGM
jgi:transposase-like protein